MNNKSKNNYKIVYLIMDSKIIKNLFLLANIIPNKNWNIFA